MVNKRSVPMTKSERKELVKRLYGAEDNHMLTKVLEFFGLSFDAPLKWDQIAKIALLHIVTVYAFSNSGLNLRNIKIASVVWGRSICEAP
jgi:hypothetical protein